MVCNTEILSTTSKLSSQCYIRAPKFVGLDLPNRDCKGEGAIESAGSSITVVCTIYNTQDFVSPLCPKLGLLKGLYMILFGLELDYWIVKA